MSRFILIYLDKAIILPVHPASVRFNASRICVNASPNSLYARAKPPFWLKGASSKASSSNADASRDVVANVLQPPTLFGGESPPAGLLCSHPRFKSFISLCVEGDQLLLLAHCVPHQRHDIRQRPLT